MAVHQEGFTAAEIALALQGSKRGGLAALANTAAVATKLVGGNAARVWRIDQLPRRMKTLLQDAAARQQLDACTFIATGSPWKSKYPIYECSEDAIARASLLQRALAPSLEANLIQFESRADFEAAGVEEYRRVFGHSVTTRHWRRLFKRTLYRDGGGEELGPTGNLS